MEQRNQQRQPKLLARLSDLKSKRLIITVAVVIIAVSVVGFLFITNRPLLEPSLISQADFAVYTPNHAPKGYEIIDSQTSLSRGILSYSFVSQTDQNKITITVQQRPGQFDSTQFTKGGSVSSVAVDNGTLYDLSIANASQYLLDTGDALVYLTASNRVDQPVMQNLATSLTRRN